MYLLLLFFFTQIRSNSSFFGSRNKRFPNLAIFQTKQSKKWPQQNWNVRLKFWILWIMWIFFFVVASAWHLNLPMSDVHFFLLPQFKIFILRCLAKLLNLFACVCINMCVCVFLCNWMCEFCERMSLHPSVVFKIPISIRHYICIYLIRQIYENGWEQNRKKIQ